MRLRQSECQRDIGGFAQARTEAEDTRCRPAEDHPRRSGGFAHCHRRIFKTWKKFVPQLSRSRIATVTADEKLGFNSPSKPARNV
jgi:hypothetical protein